MLRTLVIGFGAFLLATVIFASAVFLSAIFLGHGYYSLYFAVNALTGIAVGAFVGALQVQKAGLLAIASLLPIVCWTIPRSQLFTCGCPRAILILLANALMMFLAFTVAHRLSHIRNRRRIPATSG